MTEYTAKVIGTNPELNIMTVEYTTTGHDPVVVSMKMPFSNQPISEVIRQCAPTSLWDQATRGIQHVSIGHTETMSDSVLSPPQSVQSLSPNHQMWSDIEFEQRVAKALVKFGVLATDPTTIKISKL